jgi:CHAT domain-containing protein
MMAASRFRDSPAECSGLLDRQWPALPESGIEVEEIAALAPPGVHVQVATGEAASEELFRREAPKQETLHVATHAFFATEKCAAALAERTRKEVGLEAGESAPFAGNPLLLSGLVLAGAGRSDDQRSDDGVLTAEEIAGLDLTRVRLAVLSACDTGQGRIAVGEGVFGLRRALEMAGVRTVVMSLWRVPDREARQWMKSFYTRLFDGAAADEAARSASLDALHRLRARNQPTHPYFWSGFVTVGDWR